MNISCVVLAGGKGRRLDCNKITVTVGNLNLLRRVINIISSFNSEIIIFAANRQSLPQLTVSQRLRIVTDIYPDKGAIGGLHTGLISSDSFYNLIVASDMPFLNPQLLHYMVELSDGFDAVVPRIGSLLEPLHAVYTKDCIPLLEQQIMKGNLKMSDLYPSIKVKYLDTQIIDWFDPEHLSLFNVNTKVDLIKAEKVAGNYTTDVAIFK